MALWRPSRDIRSLQEGMRQVLNAFLGRSGSPEGPWSSAWTPPVDIYDTGDAFVLRAELPGAPKRISALSSRRIRSR
jgi:HSP20 family molecular chaperone IbpA